MDLELGLVDAALLVSLAAAAAVIGRAVELRRSAPLVAALVVGLGVALASVGGAVLAAAALGLALLVGNLLRDAALRADAEVAPGGGGGAGAPPATAVLALDWPNPDELTPREVEVLGLIASGSSNQEIADGLHISMATVKTHVNHIFTKTGVRDRAQAVAYAYDRGLVSAPPTG